MGDAHRQLPLDGSCVVVGLGSTGLSTLAYLQSQGISAAAYDQNRLDRESGWCEQIRQRIALEDCHFADEGKWVLAEADCIFLSPGIAPDADWLRDSLRAGCVISGDLDLFASAVNQQNAEVIAITGSNAKSTVTTLVASMIEAQGRRVAVGGNLGTPMLDLLDSDVEVYVLELSSFQLERSEGLQGHTGCILNVSPDHLDRHGTMQVYQQQKQKIYKSAARQVYFSDDLLTRPESGLLVDSAVRFGSSEQDDFRLLAGSGGYVAFGGVEELFDDSVVTIKGSHNLMNLVAACAISAGHASTSAMRQICQSFAGLPHRSEFVGEINGINFINDSKATNVGAAMAAIMGVSGQGYGRVYLIAGGVGKGADFSELVEACRDVGCCLILLGEAATEIAAAAGVAVDTLFVSDLDDALALAYSMASPGDTVLLAPACASFDMFDSYIARGHAFCKAFDRLRKASESTAAVDRQGGASV